jgi:hypothetical protein
MGPLHLASNALLLRLHSGPQRRSETPGYCAEFEDQRTKRLGRFLRERDWAPLHRIDPLFITQVATQQLEQSVGGQKTHTVKFASRKVWTDEKPAPERKPEPEQA